jgi:hypothetical protein
MPISNLEIQLLRSALRMCAYPMFELHHKKQQCMDEINSGRIKIVDIFCVNVLFIRIIFLRVDLFYSLGSMFWAWVVIRRVKIF